ncbi:MAG: hypothetical protein JSV56_11030 [Methanomassiliicoccales archaeon]|nr:MAG: hypothetical protein JSV56_11030 [Methanomassiliicoccales archaeon]
MVQLSTRISLSFRRYQNLALRKKIPGFEIVRLETEVSFKINDQWSKPETAIIDTGAHISVIPFSIWKVISVEHIGSHTLEGIVHKKECMVPVDIGKIKCVLLDRKGNETRDLDVISFLAPTDDIPIVLGYRDLLTEFKICLGYKKNIAYLED